MVLTYTSRKIYRSVKGSVSTRTTSNGGTEKPTAEATARQEKRPSSTPNCGHEPDPESESCSTCKSVQRAQRKYRYKLLGGLVLPFVLQALDVTIIASALPWIASDFNETGQLNWIIAAFNLTSAAFIPFWGQIADIFGRHVSIQASLVFMLVGSALCTGAPVTAFPVLLLGRALQGLACAGLSVVIRIIVADKVSLSENAKNWSIFTFLGGAIGYGLGPFLGGYITSRSNWRWCFGINLPVAFASIIVVYFALRSELLGPQPIPQLDESTETGRRTTFAKRLQTIDVGGQFLFLFGFGLLILGFSWAGSTYAWASPAVLVALILGLIICTIFILWEYYMAPGRVLALRFPSQQAMFPWELVRHRDSGLLFYTSFSTGMAMYAVLYFCNIYFTMVKLWSADEAGLQLLFYIPGIAAGAYISVFMCNSWPRKTFPPIFLGSIIEMIGIGLIAWAIYTEHNPTVYGMMALAGVGTGLRLMPVPLQGIGYFPQKIAAVVSLMAVAYPFGGTLGLTIMTTVFNNASGIGNSSPLRDFEILKDLPSETQNQVTHDAKMGVVWAFVAICPFMVICTIVSAFLGNVYIKKTVNGENEGENEVYEGVYLLSLFCKHGAAKNVTTREHQSAGEPTLP
ncbi:putative MFS-type transporter C16A3.17c 1 [Colletotrichum chlorophyti]|uniref:Putative MFS-type transporter C16A3.17c 1 n=1 Tax=Colletotrichum chlorophyti TaxID=708187 RepID=A0A1Q8RYP5_9PEZI|nr:putative MFS-type transporter C16A3.17c 1 [Colletotrichum chlorophyti]